jgi:trypsin
MKFGVTSYRPEVINAKLAFLPQAKAALKLEKVKSCEDSKRFIDYMNENPGLTDMFDPNPLAESPIPMGQDSVGEPSGAPLEKTSIFNGTAMENRGLVEITMGFSQCTGAILDYRTIITSAHCVDQAGTGDVFDAYGYIDYYDPADNLATPRSIHAGNMHVRIHPPYSGEGDYQSDIAVLYIDGSWPNVTIYDNIRIYNSHPMYQYVKMWGRGYNTAGGGGLGTLRYSASTPVTNPSGTHGYTTRAIGHGICRGDSGGPDFRDDVNINFAIGLHSMVSGLTGDCATPNTYEYSTCIAPKVGWIMSVAPISCYSMNTFQGKTPYIRCF